MRLFSIALLQICPAARLVEIVSKGVDDHGDREVLDLQAPKRLCAEVLICDDLSFFDTFAEQCAASTDRAEVDRAVLLHAGDHCRIPPALADHAVRGVLRGIHQAVRPDDPSVCQYHGRTYDHPRPHLPDLYHGIDGVVGEFRNDDRFGAVLRVHELSGIAGGLSASIYIHIIVSQLYRFG